MLTYKEWKVLELNEMPNLQPNDTNLGAVIFVSQRGRASHGPRIKVRHDNNDFSITVSETPEIVAGRSSVSNKELKRIFSWIKMNKEILMKLWNSEIHNVDELYDKIKPLRD